MSEPSQGRSLPWFRVDVDLVDHPKVLALADALDCAEAEAGWLVVRLWAWTMRYAARGRLAPGARPALERLWNGAGTAPESGSVVDALVRAGFLDASEDGGWEVHDWDEHNGAAVAKAEKDAERKRTARARRSNGRGQSADGRADGAGNGTGRDGTEQTTTIVEDKPRPRRARPMAIKPASDPRHAPLVARLGDAFKTDRSTAYPFGARDAKAVANLLARAEPDVIVAAWERALRHQGYPTVATLAQLEQHLAQFVAAPRADATKGYAPPSVFTETKEVLF